MPAPTRRAALLAATSAALARPARAAAPPRPSPADVARDYDGFAATYDSLDGGPLAAALGLPALRTAAAARTRGDVLEVAVGTGLGLESYWIGHGCPVPAASPPSPPSLPPALTSLTLVDVSPAMLARARARAASLGLAAASVVADVAALPFADASFDTAVDAFGLCVFPDPAAALAELARVLRPGGTAVLVENARSANGAVGAYQDATAALAARLGGKGCAYNTDVPALVGGTRGLELVGEERRVGGVFGVFVARRV